MVLNVYDPHPHNDTLRKFGLGVYHTGIEVNGMEYSYGGSPHAVGTGVFLQPPQKDDREFF